MERPSYTRRSSSRSSFSSLPRTSRSKSRTRLSSTASFYALANNENHSSASLTSPLATPEDSLISVESLVLNATIDNTLPLDYFKQDILSVLKSLRIPKWRRIERSHYSLINVERLSGAMTNCIYKLTYLNYYPILLRIYGDVENIIDRDSELLTLIRLSKKNIGPKLLGLFTNGRFEEYLNNSTTLTKSEIREPKISRMIARRMKEFHKGVTLTFDEINDGPKSWILIEKWIRIVDELIKNSSEKNQKDVFILNWLDFKNLIQTYKKWLYAQYESTEKLKDSLKFCHNDTQYGNLLFYDKSQSLSMEDDDDEDNSANSNAIVDEIDITNLSLTDSISKNTALPLTTDNNFQFDTRLTVIDFEYAGQNPPAYDITNHFCEWMYDYHAPLANYKTDETKYPSVEERLNLLNSYVNYVPGSRTPHLNPVGNQKGERNSESRTTLKHSSSRVSVRLAELPLTVRKLYNETVYWRSTTSIFWSLWAIISKGSIGEEGRAKDTAFENTKFETGPNGEKYQITVNSEEQDNADSNDSEAEDEFLKPTLDDEFDHLKYALGKIGIVMGDMIQFGLIQKDSIEEDRLKYVKYLDTELLPTN